MLQCKIVCSSAWDWSPWCYLFCSIWLWRWKQEINGVILDETVPWFLVLSVSNTCWFTLYSMDWVTAFLLTSVPLPSSLRIESEVVRHVHSHHHISASDWSSWGVGAMQITTTQQESFCVSSFFLRCISSKTGRWEPRQTKVFHSH